MLTPEASILVSKIHPKLLRAIRAEARLLAGIDHLYAIKTIDEVHKAGGKIKSFLSYCGGLNFFQIKFTHC